MNAFISYEVRERCSAAPRLLRCLSIAALFTVVGLGLGAPLGHAQDSDNDSPGAEVLTRGPVHEAFAGVISFNAEPGIVVTKAPPENIEEIPPDEKPEGDNVAWVPGYWSWDDERNDFVWVSGIWRTLPPGREWIAGYWGQTSQGFQWTSGYWADESSGETSYLPPPPETVEAGPNVAAPSMDYSWIPGSWVWYRGRYAWRPGYWTEGRADWDWIPASYIWTPRGYLFIDGYWDYPAERRGILFAPVYFESGVYSHQGYHYSPRIVISLSVFSDHLFLRPRYHHYYFGDYYAPRYGDEGIYASFSFQSGRHGYDPFFNRQRWEHRQDREWEHHVATTYQYRRENEAARPPRTWAAQRKINTNNLTVNQNNIQVAVTIDQVARRKDNPVHFQKVSSTERQSMAQSSQAVQKNREQRRTLETKPAQKSQQQSKAKTVTPERVQLPRSSIAAKPSSGLRKEQAPPAAPKAPKPDLRPKPKSESTGRQPNPQRKPQPAESRQPDAARQPASRTNDPVPPVTRPQTQGKPATVVPEANREKQTPRKAPEKQPAPRPDDERRKREAADKAKEDAQRNNARGLEKKTHSEAVERQKASTLKAQEEAATKAQNLKRQQQEDTARQSREAAAKALENAQRNKSQVDESTRKQTLKPAPKKVPSPPEKEAPARDKDKSDKDDKK